MFLWKVKIVIALCHPLLIYLYIAGNLPTPSKDQEPYHVKANQAINCNAKWIVKQYFWIGSFFSANHFQTTIDLYMIPDQ